MEELKHQKINNINYRKFLDEGIIHTLDELEIEKALNNIKGKYQIEARSLLIDLYYTGARPNEVLQHKAKDYSIEGSYLKIKVIGSKGGLPRTIYLPLRLKLVSELKRYSTSLFEDMLIYPHYLGSYNRIKQTKKGQIETIETTDKLRYHIKRWFKNVIEGSITTYYLRHNRFSKLSEGGLSMEELRQMKGSKTFNSIYPYLHMSSKAAKNIAKKIN
jgi:integrase